MSQPKERAICSSPTCTWKGLIDNLERAYSRANFCPRCGERLMFSCPHCRTTIHDHKEPHCMNCGKPLKVQLKVSSAPQSPQKRSPSRRRGQDN